MQNATSASVGHGTQCPPVVVPTPNPGPADASSHPSTGSIFKTQNGCGASDVDLHHRLQRRRRRPNNPSNKHQLELDPPRNHIYRTLDHRLHLHLPQTPRRRPMEMEHLMWTYQTRSKNSTPGYERDLREATADQFAACWLPSDTSGQGPLWNTERWLII